MKMGKILYCNIISFNQQFITYRIRIKRCERIYWDCKINEKLKKIALF